MEITPFMYLVVCPLVFLAAFVDSIAGGGGLISLPAYQTGAGLPHTLSGGSNKFSACLGTMVATYRFARSGKLPLGPALLAVPGSVLGAILGTLQLQKVPEQFAKTFMLVALPVMLVLILIKPPQPKYEKQEFTTRRKLMCVGIGFACGMYDGFFGPGNGTILILLFTWLVGLDTVSASGAAKLVNLASNLASLAIHWSLGNILFALSIPAGLCSIAGGYLGSKMAIRLDARFIRAVMLVVVLALIAKTAYDTFALS